MADSTYVIETTRLDDHDDLLEEDLDKYTKVVIKVPSGLLVEFETKKQRIDTACKILPKIQHLRSLHVVGENEEGSLNLMDLARLVDSCRGKLEEINTNSIAWKLPPTRNTDQCSTTFIQASSLKKIHFDLKECIYNTINSSMACFLIKLIKNKKTSMEASAVSSQCYCKFQRLLGDLSHAIEIDMDSIELSDFLVLELKCLCVLAPTKLKIFFGTHLKHENGTYFPNKLSNLNLVELDIEDTLSVRRSAKLINCFVDKIEPTLVSLSLCMRVQNREEFVKLGEILRNSTGSLKQLCLTIKENPSRFSPISLLQPVAENKTLEIFCLSSYFLHSRDLSRIQGGENQAEICSKIQEYLAVRRYTENDPVTSVLKNFEEALESTNTSLRSVTVCQPYHPPRVLLAPTRVQRRAVIPKPINVLSDKGKFWLKMNACGRKKLLSSPENTSMWINTIIGQKSDLSVTFVLMRLNPSLLNPSTEASSGATIPCKKRKHC